MELIKAKQIIDKLKLIIQTKANENKKLMEQNKQLQKDKLAFTSVRIIFFIQIPINLFEKVNNFNNIIAGKP